MITKMKNIVSCAYVNFAEQRYQTLHMTNLSSDGRLIFATQDSSHLLRSSESMIVQFSAVKRLVLASDNNQSGIPEEFQMDWMHFKS